MESRCRPLSVLRRGLPHADRDEKSNEKNLARNRFRRQKRSRTADDFVLYHWLPDESVR